MPGDEVANTRRDASKPRRFLLKAIHPIERRLSLRSKMTTGAASVLHAREMIEAFLRWGDSSVTYWSHMELLR